MDPQRLFTQVEIKAVSTERREITGYAAASGNKDRTGDVIDTGAFDRTLTEHSDVPVFIGHDTSRLQVGEAISMKEDDAGLLTVTSVYDTPDGNALLEVAKRRLAKGKTLGMSIGYRTKSDKWVGNTRHLTDVDLVEYSFLASPDFAANPLAQMVGVKKRKATGSGPVITTDDSYEELMEDLEDAACMALGVMSCCVCATFPDHVVVSAYSMEDDDQHFWDIPYTLNADGEPELGTPTSVDPAFVPVEAKARAQHQTKERPMPTSTRTVAWDAAFVSALPDSAFAHIEGGGTATKDETGRTQPLSLRHYPHHNPDGSVDADHLEHALSHAPTAGDVGEKSLAHLAGHAHAALLGVDPHAPEWQEGAAAAMLSLVYKFDQIIMNIAKDRAAMERVGIDTKAGARLNSATREKLADLHISLGRILDWADAIEKGDDGKMRVEMFKHKLAMLKLLEEVS